MRRFLGSVGRTAALGRRPSLAVAARGVSAGGGYMMTGTPERLITDRTRILVTGAAGQIGSEAVQHLRDIFGERNVIASDIKQPFGEPVPGQFIYCDVQQYDTLARIVIEHRITAVVHLASLLSAVGERNPQLAIRVNTRGTENVLELARLNELTVFIPSSIAVFGATTPKHETPNETIMRPNTIYGVTKVYTELLGEYYHSKYGVDFRSVRFPGIISNKVQPGGGTTDYAVDIYYEALRKGKYTCFLEEHQALPMMYMPDCLKVISSLIKAPNEDLTARSYNVTGMSFTPKDLEMSIQKFMPNFKVDYKIDFRQKIAETWPSSIDDSLARKDWGWQEDFDIDSMTKDMLSTLKPRISSMDEPM